VVKKIKINILIINLIVNIQKLKNFNYFIILSSNHIFQSMIEDK